MSDDGHGFVPGEAAGGHVGLALMNDLAAQVGGELTVTSAPGQGTHVSFRMQCP